MAGFVHRLRRGVANRINPKEADIIHSRPLRRHDSMPHDYQGRVRNFRGNPPDRANAAEANITVNRCINFRINHLRNQRWNICNTLGRPVKSHPFHNMLKWHHKEYSVNFFERWIKMLLIHGNVYMEKLYRDDGLPGGIFILNSIYVNPEIKDSKVAYFEYIQPGTVASPKKVPSDLIMWDILSSAISDFRGKSPMDRAIEAVNLDRKGMLTLESYLDNDGLPATIITGGPNSPNYSSKQIKEFVDYWESQGQGARHSYKTKFLPGNLNVFPFSGQKPDMVYSYEMASLICREFAIDPSLVGVYDQADSNNSPAPTEMETKFINALTDAVLPDMHHIEDFINSHILPFLSPHTPGYEFKWDYNEIDRMIRYSDKAIDQLRSDAFGGFITKNEYRTARFFKPIPVKGGDVYVVPKGYVHVSEDEMGDLPLLREIDPKVLEGLIKGAPSVAFAASASPDFAEINVSSEIRPGENRYMVEEKS